MASSGVIEPGSTFGRLTVVGISHQDKRWRRHYSVRCSCGVEKTVQGALLRSGNTKSCGCLARENKRLRVLGHGVASANQVYAGYRHKAGSAGIVFSLTKSEFRTLVSLPCFYCGATATNVHRSPHGSGDFAYNGLDRIDPRRGYALGNVVPSCRSCNFAKSDRSQGEFMEWIRRAYSHLSSTAMADQWGRMP